MKYLIIYPILIILSFSCTKTNEDNDKSTSKPKVDKSKVFEINDYYLYDFDI